MTHTDPHALTQQVKEPKNIEALNNYALMLDQASTDPSASNLTFSTFYRSDRFLAGTPGSPFSVAGAGDQRVGDEHGAGRQEGLPGAREVAEGLFQTALKVNSAHVPSLCNYATFLVRGNAEVGDRKKKQQEMRLARELLTRALRVEPLHLDSLSSLGACTGVRSVHANCRLDPDLGIMSCASCLMGKSL